MLQELRFNRTQENLKIGHHTLCDLEQLSGHAVLSDQSQKPSCCALPQKRYKQQTSKFD